MLTNEIFALQCLERYAEYGIIVDKTNGVFAHCPLPKGMGDTGYYLTWEDHQHQGLLQSVDIGKRCFWVGDTKKWLNSLEYFPDDYFKLWDIYEKFISGEHSGYFGVFKKRKPRAKETKYKLRKANLGKKLPSNVRNKISKTKTGKLNTNGQKVEVVFPDGKVEIYPTVAELQRRLQGCYSTLREWSSNNRTPRRGKFAGYTFRYAHD